MPINRSPHLLRVGVCHDSLLCNPNFCHVCADTIKQLQKRYRKVYILLNYYIIMVIQIQISDEVWNYLNKEKQRGETFDNVLTRKLKIKTKVVKSGRDTHLAE